MHCGTSPIVCEPAAPHHMYSVHGQLNQAGCDGPGQPYPPQTREQGACCQPGRESRQARRTRRYPPLTLRAFLLVKPISTMHATSASEGAAASAAAEPGPSPAPTAPSPRRLPAAAAAPARLVPASAPASRAARGGGSSSSSNKSTTSASLPPIAAALVACVRPLACSRLPEGSPTPPLNATAPAATAALRYAWGPGPPACAATYSSSCQSMPELPAAAAKVAAMEAAPVRAGPAPSIPDALYPPPPAGCAPMPVAAVCCLATAAAAAAAGGGRAATAALPPPPTAGRWAGAARGAAAAAGLAAAGGPSAVPASCGLGCSKRKGPEVGMPSMGSILPLSTA